MTTPKIKIVYAIIAAALGLALSTSLITPALAESPHFLGTPICTTTSSGTDTKTLTCSGKIVGGLGNVRTAGAQLRATVTVPCAGLPFLPTSAIFPVSSGQTPFTASITFGNACPPVTFSGVHVAVFGIGFLPIPGTFV
jgi:hypothetical protein